MADIPLRVVTTQAGIQNIEMVKGRMMELQRQLEIVQKQQSAWGANNAQLAARLKDTEKAILGKITALNQESAASGNAAGATQGLSLAQMALGAAAGVAAAALAVLVAGMVAGVGAAIDYEKKMVQIEVLTGAQPELVHEWGDALKDLAGEVGKAPTELAEALYFVASAGQTGANALDIVKKSAQASMIGMGETGAIAKATTAVMNAYAESNLTAGHAMDVLLATVREGGAEANEYAGTIGRVAGVAANFGITIEEVGAFMATFTRVIPSAAEAATSLRQTILNLMAPSDETKEALKRLGMSAEELRISIREKGLMATLADLMEKTGGNVEELDHLIPNVRALAGVMATAGSQGQAYKDVLFSIQTAHGDFDRAVEKTEETVSARWDKMKASIQSALLSMGDAALQMFDTTERLLGKGGGVAQFLVEPPDPKPWNDFEGTLGKTWDTLGAGVDVMGGVVEAHALETQASIDSANAKEKKKAAEEAAQKAAESHGKAVARLVEEMQNGSKNLDIMAAALDRVGGVSGLSAEQIKKYGSEVEKAAKTGADLTSAQRELLAVYKESQWIEQWNEHLGKQRELAEEASDSVFDLAIDANRLADTMGGPLGIAMEASDEQLVDFIEDMEALLPTLKEAEARGMDTSLAQETLATALAEAAGRGLLAGKALKTYEENLKANVEATRELIGVTTDLSFEWADLLDLLDALGIDSESSIGTMVQAFADGEALIQQTNKALEDGVVTMGEMIGLAAGLVKGFKNATDSASALTRALGGAAFGAQIGSAIGGLFGPAGAAIGAIAGGLIGGVAGIFRKPAWVKVGEEAGKVLGVGISEGLAKTIEKDMKALSLTAAQAALLHITDAAEESGRSVASFSAQLGQLMQGVKDGSIPAKEGMDELTRAFEALRDEGGPALLEFIQRTRELGLEIPAVTAHVNELLGQAASGLTALFAGIAMSETDAAALFAGTFAAIAGEQGLLAAIKQLSPAWDELVKRFEVFGPEALAILGPIPELMGLMGEKTKPIIDGLDAAVQVLRGLGDSGYLTADSFNAMQNSAQNAFDQLIANGASEQAALAAIAPLLAELQRQADQYGIELSENTKKLIGQAEANGIAFAPEPQQVMIDLLKEIVLLMGGEIPESARQARTGIENAFDGIEINIPVNYNEGEVPGGHGGVTGGLPHAQHGIVLRGTAEGTPLVMGENHTPEIGAPVAAVLHSMQQAAVGAALAAVGGSGGGDTKVEVHLRIGEQSFDELMQSRLDGGYIKQPKHWARAR